MPSAPISCSSSGSNTLLAGISGYRIRVLSYVLVVTTAVTAKFQSNATDLTGALPLGANGGVASGPSNPGSGHFITAAGEALNLTLGGNVAVAGHFAYEVV